MITVGLIVLAVSVSSAVFGLPFINFDDPDQ
jgi:hypothetical protein